MWVRGHRSLGLGLVLAVGLIAGEARAADDLKVIQNGGILTMRDRGDVQLLHRLSSDRSVVVKVRGPTVLQIDLRVHRKPKDKGAESGKIQVVRDGFYVIDWAYQTPPGKNARLTLPSKGVLSAAVNGQLQVPAGDHVYEVKLAAKEGKELAVDIITVAQLKPSLKLPSEVAAAGAPPPAMAAKDPVPASAPPLPPAVEPPPAEASTASRAAALDAELAAKEKRGAALGITTGSGASRAAASEAPAPEPVQVAKADGSVRGSTHALAAAITAGYAQASANSGFHRIAIPYFKELGGSVSEHHLGQLTAELVAAELGKNQLFVVVERERLDQVMREHRLKDLGVIDETQAARFGKVLGAQSILSGTVAEAGPKYVVTVRQVDAETGRVLVTGNVDIARDGLVALSSDAVVLRSKGGAAFRSALVPGWGQLYNQEPVKSATFLAVGLGALGGAAGYYVAANSASSKYKENRADTVRYRDVANDRLRMVNGLLIGYGVVWAVNLLDAYVSGREGSTVELPASGTGSTAGL